ncbi:mitogen-activated protein kinase kinase kinase 20-like [Solanum dulcamara]|uniref:mitogen-activated protein kinase kinase kinase 20-like n=1 Tax=Solanum dulcamara TaxID=45834 RepID=UPI0024864FEE|nr:mitogen-activated protein kinase kinase kinase 20-like [Solanum dulcamara]
MTVKIDPSSLCASVAAVKCCDIRRSISLQQEAQILTTLKGSPYVVQFFGADVSIDNGNIPTYNLFLEYASGGSLHDLINNYKKGMRKMSELEVGFYAYQLLKGIQHIHKKGWVHCDIKPANVLVLDNAERGGMHKLKLADFGLSLRIAEGMAYMTGKTLSNRGTLLYASKNL